MSEALYAEAGSIIDLSGDPFIDLAAFVYTPGTSILGAVPTDMFEASVRQVPSIALDPSAGFFRSGYPIHFTVVGNGGIESVPSTTYFPAFEWVSLTAVPGTGSYFQGWSGALASSKKSPKRPARRWPTSRFFVRSPNTGAAAKCSANGLRPKRCFKSSSV